jgi:hypothetical protein
MAPTFGPDDFGVLLLEEEEPVATQTVCWQAWQDTGTSEHSWPSGHDGQDGVVFGQDTQLRPKM